MATASAPNHDGMMLLEAPFARVPHDELRRHLRTQQRYVERDLTFCSSTLDMLAKSARLSASPGSQGNLMTVTHTSGTSAPQTEQHNAGMTSLDAEDQGDASAVDASLLADVSFASETRGEESFLNALTSEEGGLQNGKTDVTDGTSLANKSGSELERSLDLMIGRVKGLKRKLASVHESAGSTLSRLEARTAHLDQLHHIQSTASPAFDEWCRTRLDRMLVDWMLRKGFARSAETLAKNRRIENHVDLHLFAEIARIEASLIGTPRTQDGRNETVTRSCGPTLAWCSENKAALRKIRSTLEFDLRFQEFIELTRARTPQSLQEAIAYSRRYLLPYLSTSSAAKISGDADGSTSKGKLDDKDEREEGEQQDAIRKQVARVMGLLACGPGGWAYHDLYDLARWQTLRTKFRAAALQIHSLPPQPLLHIALSAGLSSLKLPACYADEPSRTTLPPAHLGGRAFGDERSNLLSVAGVTSTSVSAPPMFPPAAGMGQGPPSVVLSPPSNNNTAGQADDRTGSPTVCAHLKNDNCPVCDPNGLGILAKEVPWSHHVNSTLVCVLSGRIMDENDPPMALPNGRVYSLTALQEMAASSQDGATVVCPRTGSSFPISSLRKVYIS